MTDTMSMYAPTGVCGEAGGDARPYPGVFVCPTAEPARGTGQPIGGFAADVRGMTRNGIALLRPLTSVAGMKRTYAPAAQRSTKNDDTTLGVHSPGRPQS